MSEERNRVVVTDFDMPFWSMVTFMVKWAIASIPAAVILVVLTYAAWTSLRSFIQKPMAVRPAASSRSVTSEEAWAACVNATVPTDCMESHGFKWNGYRWESQ